MESVLAKMIHNVYHDKTAIKNFELVAKTDSAQIYKNDKTKMWIYVVRGWKPSRADETLDITALVNSTIADRPRYKRVKAFFQEHPAPEGYKVLATGHSMGGAYVDQLIEDGVVETGISFNPAIQIKDISKTANKRYYNKHDFLYKLIGMHSANHHVVNSSWLEHYVYSLRFLDIMNSLYAHKIERFIEPEHESGSNYIVQSVHLSKDKFEDVHHAKQWIQEHGYKHQSVDETPNEYRFRQVSPKLIETGHYRVKSVKIGDKGDLIIMYR